MEVRKSTNSSSQSEWWVAAESLRNTLNDVLTLIPL